MLSFIISPIFSYEYNKNTARLILTTKNGKNSLIKAKIFVAITIGALTMFFFNVTILLVTLSIYGFDGGAGKIQLLMNYSVFNFTMLQMVLLILTTSTLGGVLQAIICMFVSSYSEKSIIPMTVSIIAIGLSGSFIGVPVLSKIIMFLPQSIGRVDYVIQPIIFNLFGLSFMFYEAIFIFVIPLIIILCFFTFKRFKNYEG